MPSPYWYIHPPEQQSSVQPVCCKPYLKSVWNEPETRRHFLTECQPLQKLRNRGFKKIQSVTDVDILNMVPMCDVTQLILDPSMLFYSKTVIDKIELHSR